MIGCTVAANLLLKSGATGMDPGIAGFISRLLSWRVLLGLGCFACSAMLYLLILSWLPLSLAQTFAAAQFIAVILASAFVLAEPVSGPQWAGMFLIAAGIVVVGVSR
jgi:drug/metabolite transporter (DMT)-like permease